MITSYGGTYQLFHHGKRSHVPHGGDQDGGLATRDRSIRTTGIVEATADAAMARRAQPAWSPLGELSRCMHRLLGAYAEHYNRAPSPLGTSLAGGYKALLVQDGDYFLEVSRYIHANPDHNSKTKPVGTYPW